MSRADRCIWASSWDGASRAPLRIGVAATVAVSQAVEAYQVAWQAGDPRYPPSGALSQSLVDMPQVAWVLWVVTAIALLGVAFDRRPIVAGAVALVSSAVLSEWQTQIFGSPSRNAFFPGAVLLGWTLGQTWAVNVGSARALRERLAEAGAVGCIAAAYVGSALSKLLATGVGWADGVQVRALILEQQPLANWAWLASYRAAFVESDAMAVAASIATLVIEGGAFLLLFGPRLRFFWALLLLGLHVNITLLNTMPYVGASLLLLLLCVPWKRKPSPEPRLVSTAPLPMFVLLGGLVVAAWALSGFGWRATG